MTRKEIEMRDLLIGLGLAAGIATMYGVAYARADDIAPTTRAAISALYVAGDDAQRAITFDYCSDVTPDELAGDALTGEALRQYGHVQNALMDAFAASDGTDSGVERVAHDYCAAASER